MKHLLSSTTLGIIMLISFQLNGMENSNSEVKNSCKKVCKGFHNALFNGPAFDYSDLENDHKEFTDCLNNCDTGNENSMQKFLTEAKKKIAVNNSTEKFANSYTLKFYLKAKSYVNQFEILSQVQL